MTLPGREVLSCCIYEMMQEGVCRERLSLSASVFSCFYVEETSFWEQGLQTKVVNIRQHLNMEILSGVPKILVDFFQIHSVVIVTLSF